MKAFILAAGYGTRLLPVTRSVSKVSLPLAGTPVVVRVLHSLRRAGAGSFLVNLHHGAESVRQALADCGEETEFSHEEEILGTGGALYKSALWLGQGETFVLVNGDCFYGEIPLEPALWFHRKYGALATMLLLDMPAGERYGAVEVDGEGRVLRIAGKPSVVSKVTKSLHFCGIHLIEPDLIRHIRPGFSDIVQDVYIPLIGWGAPIYGYHAAFAWQDLGTPARYLNAAGLLLREVSGPSDRVVLGEGCRVAESAEVGPLVELGREVTVGPDSRIVRSVICDGVSIGGNCVVEDSIIGPGSRIASGAELRMALAAGGEGALESRSWKRD